MLHGSQPKGIHLFLDRSTQGIFRDSGARNRSLARLSGEQRKKLRDARGANFLRFCRATKPVEESLAGGYGRVERRKAWRVSALNERKRSRIASARPSRKMSAVL